MSLEVLSLFLRGPKLGVWEISEARHISEHINPDRFQLKGARQSTGYFFFF